MQSIAAPDPVKYADLSFVFRLIAAYDIHDVFLTFGRCRLLALIGATLQRPFGGPSSQWTSNPPQATASARITVNEQCAATCPAVTQSDSRGETSKSLLATRRLRTNACRWISTNRSNSSDNGLLIDPVKKYDFTVDCCQRCQVRILETCTSVRAKHVWIFN